MGSLAKEGVLPLIADKVFTSTVSAVVKKEMAFAIAKAANNLKSCAAKERPAFQACAKQLEAALCEGSTTDKHIKEQLQKARTCIREINNLISTEARNASLVGISV